MTYEEERAERIEEVANKVNLGLAEEEELRDTLTEALSKCIKRIDSWKDIRRKVATL